MKLLFSLVLMGAMSAQAGILVGPVISPVNQHTYYLLTQNTWSNAEAEAVSLGGHLATIRNAREQDWIFEMFGARGGALWIGLTDREKTGVFKWMSGEPFDYANWEEAEPDNGTGGVEFYTHLWPAGGRSPGKWNDYLNADNVFGTPFYGVVEISNPATETTSSSHSQANFSYETFASSDGLILQQHAALLDGRIRLTPAIGGKGLGGVWRDTKQPVKNGFETTFQIQFSDKYVHGGDGIAFVVQNNTFPALGWPGCNIGFGGLTNLFVIKFDNYHWQNSAYGSYDEIAVLEASSPTTTLWDDVSNTIASATNGVVFSDGAVHTARIVYVPGNLQVYLDDMENPLMTVYVNIAKAVNLDEGRAWIGFTAAGGADWQNQDLLSWSFASDPAEARVNPPTSNTSDSLSLTSPSSAVFQTMTPEASVTTPLAWDHAFGYALPPGLGATDSIEVSTDLVHWTAATNVLFFFRDLDSTNDPARFYRFVPKP